MPSLIATYASPTGTKTFTQELPATTSQPSSSQPEGTEGTKDTEETKATPDPSEPQPSEAPAPTSASQPVSQTVYLTSLSASLKTLQSDLNAFLTQKMEEDKAAATNDDVSEKDKRAEEEYGEEGGSGED
ncbi:hypothetical protein IQ07DRAFT_644475 [Pyrenochaeta sp. DS3sAY3a]|nr:hypothetical protein IQ07DRAFT_644475 [Pyrenochaeta sp. DS3sAY3a]